MISVDESVNLTFKKHNMSYVLRTNAICASWYHITYNMKFPEHIVKQKKQNFF